MTCRALHVSAEPAPEEGHPVNSSFERHGLDHLSASSINLFVAQPSMWAMQKLMGRKSAVGPAAHRGTSIEAGVEMGLFDPAASVEACHQAQHRAFWFIG